MNKSKLLKLTTLLVLLFPMTISCGGGDDGPSTPPKESITAEEYQIQEACRIFGLNKDDYDKINVRTTDDANITIMRNKNKNTLFVGIVDPITNQILFTNSLYDVTPTLSIQYYDKSYECKYTGAGFDLVMKPNGLFFVADLWYESNDAAVRKCLPIIYIFNGKQTMMIGTNDPIPNPVQLIDWHDDSCFVLLDNEYTCYTIDGKPVFALHDKEQLDNLYAANKCFLSYREFITAYYDPYVHKLTIKRVDVTDSSKLVAELISLFEDMPQDTKSTISFQKTTGHVLIEVKAISITGRTETAVFDFNIETNEITGTK